MKTALLLLSLTAASFAADEKQQPIKDPSIGPRSEEVKKLGPVTWDPDAQKLRWVVKSGSMVNGKFVPSSEKQYEISPDEAWMTTANEKRGFEEQEGVVLRRLLDVLTVYCAESVVWWEEGQGTPADSAPGKAPGKTVTPTGEKPVRVRDEAPRSGPAGSVLAAMAWMP
jgi:hypothetical protein